MRQHNTEEDLWDSSIAPDLILPCQFFEVVAKRGFSCEQRLMLAVLADAVNILRDGRTSLKVSKERLFAEAAHWVMTRGSTVPFSFDNVCDTLEISPEALRRRLSQLMTDTDSAASRARLRLQEVGRHRQITVNRSRRRERLAPLRAGRV